MSAKVSRARQWRSAATIALFCLALIVDQLMSKSVFVSAVVWLVPFLATGWIFRADLRRIRFASEEAELGSWSPAVALLVVGLAALGAVTLSAWRLYVDLSQRPSPLTAEQFAEPYLTGLSFHLADLARENSIISNRTIENCTIYGPAVVTILDGTTIKDSALEGPGGDAFVAAADPFIPVTDATLYFGGVIGLRNVTIRKSRLRRIQFLMTPVQKARAMAINRDVLGHIDLAD